MADVVKHDADLCVDARVVVSEGDEVLVFGPYEVTLPDGTVVAHESRGGDLIGARGVAVGSAWVEISHVGDGPRGGELVLSVTAGGQTLVSLGALVPDVVPESVPSAWPTALDLAINLVTDATIEGRTREELEAVLQSLVAVMR